MLPTPTEDFEQTLLVHWLEVKGYKFTAIPNSTYTTSIKQKMKNKRTGLRPGFPDMVVIVNKKIICIEMKRTRGGTLTPEQKIWIEALNYAGVPTRVCKGFEEAKAFVTEIANRDDDMWPEPLPRS
jgi:hypothetical protein